MDGMEDILQGGRDDMREALWARRFYHFCEDFHRLFFVCFLVLVGFVFGLLVLFCFLSRWKDSCK